MCVYIQYQNDQLFLSFSVNCSQVAMFQIMSALCPHGQGEGGGGQPNVDRLGQGKRRGSQKFPNMCGHPLWMTPKVTLDSVRNFVYVSIYLHLKSFAWKRDCPISSKLQTSRSRPGLL